MLQRLTNGSAIEVKEEYFEIVVAGRAAPDRAVEVGHRADKEDLEHEEDEGHDEEEFLLPPLPEMLVPLLSAQTRAWLDAALHFGDRDWGLGERDTQHLLEDGLRKEGE